MFGGVGIYARGIFFALIAEDRLYFKVNDATRPDFEQRGMEPFRPFGENSAMGYYEVPADVVEDMNHLETWMKKAIDAAVAAKGGKHKRSKPYWSGISTKGAEGDSLRQIQLLKAPRKPSFFSTCSKRLLSRIIVR